MDGDGCAPGVCAICTNFRKLLEVLRGRRRTSFEHSIVQPTCRSNTNYSISYSDQVVLRSSFLSHNRRFLNESRNNCYPAVSFKASIKLDTRGSTEMIPFPFPSRILPMIICTAENADVWSINPTNPIHYFNQLRSPSSTTAIHISNTHPSLQEEEKPTQAHKIQTLRPTL